MKLTAFDDQDALACSLTTDPREGLARCVILLASELARLQRRVQALEDAQAPAPLDPQAEGSPPSL